MKGVIKTIGIIAMMISMIGVVRAEDITSEEAGKVRMLINLLDYIAKDYRMAVKDGEVINAFEYDEMVEFSSNADMYFKELSSSGRLEGIVLDEGEIDALSALIRDTSSAAEVGAQSATIRNAILDLRLIPASPDSWPEIKKGKELFAKECATCHGVTGGGDGPTSVGLNPAPTALNDRKVMDVVSPLQAYNTITLGVEGTSMRAFQELSDDETWALAFYVMQLPFDQTETSVMKQNIELEELTNSSNEVLLTRYPDIDIAALRFAKPSSSSGTLDLARSLLQQAQQEVKVGNRDEAFSLALNAYLKGVEPAEPKIKASDNSLFQRLESEMLGVREVVKSGEMDEIDPAFEEAYAVITEAEVLLGNSERSIWTTAVIAASILVREGLEAFFVILAILGILKAMGAAKAIRWMHSGWITAVAFGIVGWFFADALMTWDSQSRELMEGVIALVAVIVLLYLGFWMHGKTNAAKWKEFVETRVKGLISRNNMIGLASFSFIVVFREAFESVLFLSSLTLDGKTESSLGVLIGTLAAGLILFMFALAMLRWFKRLPISKVFLYSSIVVLALAFVLAGEGIHAIQEGGYIDIRSFPLNIRLSFIGLYPTYETILTQLVVFGLIVFLWRYSSTKSVKAQA